MPTERNPRKQAKGHRNGCYCRWCRPEYLQRSPEDVLRRSDPTISVRIRPEEKEAFAALCERLGESPPRRIRAEILRLLEEDRESQALDRMTGFGIYTRKQTTKGEKKMRVIKFRTESGDYLVARDGSNGNLLWRSIESGEGPGKWCGSPLSSGLREFSENPLKIAQRVNQYLDRYEGSVAESVLSAEEILSGIDLEISDEGIGNVPFDHYLKAVREVMETAYPSWVEIDIKPVTRVFGHSTKISFWGLEDDAAEDSERREVHRLLEMAWEVACDTCEECFDEQVKDTDLTQLLGSEGFCPDDSNRAEEIHALWSDGGGSSEKEALIWQAMARRFSAEDIRKALEEVGS